MIFSTKAIFFSSALLLIAIQNSLAFECDLCFGNNEFSTVPAQNAKKTVETSMGTQNCQGFFLAAMGGVLKNMSECRAMRQEFAPTCCNSNGGTSGRNPPATKPDTTTATGNSGNTGDHSSTGDDSSTGNDSSTGTTGSTNSANTGDGAGSNGSQAMCTGAGYCCDLCSDPANQFDEVPEANHRKTVATSMGTVNCLGFASAAANGDVIQGQNQCLRIAQQFAPTCCNVHTSRALRGSA